MKNYVFSSFCGIYLILNLAMSNNILQRNCRSIKANFEELTLLINKQKPVAVPFLKIPKISIKIPLLLLQNLY